MLPVAAALAACDRATSRAAAQHLLAVVPSRRELSSLRARTPVATGPTSVWRATPKPSDEPRQASDAALWQAHRTPPASKGDRKVRTRRLPSPRRARLPALCVAISLAHTSGRQPTANPTPVPAPTAEGLSCKWSGNGRHGWDQRGGEPPPPPPPPPSPPALYVAISLAHTFGRQLTVNPTPVPAPAAEGMPCKCQVEWET